MTDADQVAAKARWRGKCECGHPRDSHVQLSIADLCVVAWCACQHFVLVPGETAPRVDQGPLCEPCQGLHTRWLDYTLPPPPIQLITIGNTAREMAAHQERRFTEWRDTIRFEQGLTVKHCAEGRHYVPKAASTTPG
jgi:hypothetical protein